ncbi:phosphotransferase-like protein [Paenibacillus aquistagni]|uniref:phosphotransferase-like protein n=1 Tax=Paenibacillus aquistagni TaxID=1852522 RepID=UPI003144E189
MIFLNGVTSSGKTTLVEATQARPKPYFYVVANDLFEQMISEHFLRDNYWEHLNEVAPEECADIIIQSVFHHG